MEIEARRAYARKWCSENADKVKAYQHKYNTGAKGKSTRKAKRAKDKAAMTPEQRREKYRLHAQKYGRSPQRKAYMHAYYLKRKLADKNYHRAGWLKSKYGLSMERFREMLAGQGHSCAICRVGKPGERDWHVDHCHATGAVRGILCKTCNMGLGSFGDDPAALRAAAQYLERAR